MTTQSWSTRVRHDTDATFREWGLELKTKLIAAGLTNTADTGQIDWTTVLRPGAGTNAGYEIYRFNDAMQGTAPIFIRIDYGTHTVATAPRMQITVGTATNGAGTLSGTALTTARSIHNSSTQVTDTLRNSYVCYAAGFLGISWKVGASSTEAFFAVCRTCDSSGTPDATGAMVVWGFGSTSTVTATQALRFAATAAAYTARTAVGETALGLSPQNPASSLVGSDPQVFLGWTITPRASPLFGLCGCLDTEVIAGNTFSVALVGSTPRTYIALSGTAGPFGPVSTATGPKYAMLWE